VDGFMDGWMDGWMETLEYLRWNSEGEIVIPKKMSMNSSREGTT
jgi:hypothetical protein